MEGARDALILAASGAGAVCAFDVIRALRRAARAPRFIGAVLDFLSAAAAALILWAALLVFARGETRLCEGVCTASGAMLYIFTVKSLFFSLFCVVFENIFKFLRFILKILLTPARFLYKISNVGLSKISQKSIRNGEDAYAGDDRQITHKDPG